jgi:hypothetical protein
MSKWNRRTLTLRSALRFKSFLREIAPGHAGQKVRMAGDLRTAQFSIR